MVPYKKLYHNSVEGLIHDKKHIDVMTYALSAYVLCILGLHDQKKDGTPDMMVYIHATKKGFGMIGHIDFSIDHKVYSYGNYDYRSFQMMEAIGDGVMFIFDEAFYLPFCIEHEKNTIFAFGL